MLQVFLFIVKYVTSMKMIYTMKFMDYYYVTSSQTNFGQYLSVTFKYLIMYLGTDD